MPKPIPPKLPLPAITAPGGAKPMPHADSPRVLASAVIVPPHGWICAVDGQTNTAALCTTCGTARK